MKSYELLVKTLASAVAAVGVPTSALRKTGPLGVRIDGTGIEVVHSDDADGKGHPGWVVREVAQTADINREGFKPDVEVIFVTPPYDWAGAARQAAMAVAEKRIDAMLDGVASSS